MNKERRAALWVRLHQGGIVDAPDEPGTTLVVPWYVRTMIGIAAWIAALFLLGFVFAAVAGLMRSGSGMLIAGLVLCAGAIVLLRIAPEQLFVAQFAFATSIAGQVLVVAGIFSGGWDGFDSPRRGLDAGRFLVVCAFEVGLVLLVPAYAHRVLSAMAAAAAFAGTLVVWRAGALYAPCIGVAFALVALASIRDGERLTLWQPLAAGLALALVGHIVALILEPSLLGTGIRVQPSALPSWVGPAAMIVAFAVVIALLLRTGGVAVGSPAGIAASVATIAVALAAWFVSGLLAAGIVLLVAFAIGHEVLLGLGVVALLASLSRYYYGLEVTLLVKSGALLVTGLVVLAAWYALRFLPVDQATEAPHA